MNPLPDAIRSRIKDVAGQPLQFSDGQEWWFASPGKRRRPQVPHDEEPISRGIFRYAYATDLQHRSEEFLNKIARSASDDLLVASFFSLAEALLTRCHHLNSLEASTILLTCEHESLIRHIADLLEPVALTGPLERIVDSRHEDSCDHMLFDEQERSILAESIRNVFRRDREPIRPNTDGDLMQSASLSVAAGPDVRSTQADLEPSADDSSSKACIATPYSRATEAIPSNSSGVLSTASSEIVQERVMQSSVLLSGPTAQAPMECVNVIGAPRVAEIGGTKDEAAPVSVGAGKTPRVQGAALVGGVGDRAFREPFQLGSRFSEPILRQAPAEFVRMTPRALEARRSDVESQSRVSVPSISSMMIGRSSPEVIDAKSTHFAAVPTAESPQQGHSSTSPATRSIASLDETSLDGSIQALLSALKLLLKTPRPFMPSGRTLRGSHRQGPQR
ncbi:MAG: hypothetical protein SFX72_19645 [Isosphaeraceae bacterium]|nr:hypothetical protein [Isosphaeraceae bacterium]